MSYFDQRISGYFGIMYFLRPKRPSRFDIAVMYAGLAAAAILVVWYILQPQRIGPDRNDGWLGDLVIPALATHTLCQLILGVRSVAESRGQSTAGALVQVSKVVFLYILLPITIITIGVVLLFNPDGRQYVQQLTR